MEYRSPGSADQSISPEERRHCVAEAIPVYGAFIGPAKDPCHLISRSFLLNSGN
jgi:hypothetical protein